MKNVLSLLAVSFLLTVTLTAQEDLSKTEPRFGIKAGYSSLSVKASYASISASESASGFYIGVFSEINLSESVNFQPEFTYGRYSEDGSNSDVLLIPFLFKYMPVQELGILAGPQVDFIFDIDDPQKVNRVGIGLALGLSYDITDHIIIDTRYVFGLSNRLEETEFMGSQIKVVFNYFQVGLGYRF